jgi:hypothetical protein
MRTLLVCCLAVLAVAANVPKPFKSQQTYVYRFDTQVSSSLIGASPAEIQQQAATRLRADALLEFTSERHAKLQLRGIRFGELNSELPKSQRVQPLEHFERRDIPAEVKQTLEFPLSVNFVDGVVERINFHEDDSTWSKNIKRAVLNMIQLNLKRNDVQGLKMQSSIVMSERDEKEMQVFSVPEITLEGECETVYSIQKNSRYGDDDERTQFNVTKTVNFNKCEKTSDVTYGYQVNPAEQLRCLNCLRQQQSQQQNAQQREVARFSHCQQECQPSKINEDKDIERSTFARYELVGKQEKYGIKRVSMMSQYIVKAQNPASQNTLIQVVALSELTFKENLEGSQQQIQSFKQSSVDESLLYVPEYDKNEKRFFMYGDEEFEKNSPFAKVEKKEQKVAHAIRNILRQWSDKKNGYEMDSALNFHKIVEVVRQSTVKEIKTLEQVMTQVSTEHQGDQPQSSEKLAKTLFLDALASAATQNSLKVLEQKIQQGEVSAAKAVQLLKIYTASMHSPSTRQADLLEKIAKSSIAQQSKPLQQAAWLSFGQILGALCQDKPAEAQKSLFRVETLCPQGKKDQYKKTLMSIWEQSETMYEQILALKTIGNAALDNTVEELQKIVKEKQQPTLVRMEAIDAMRRLRTGHVQKIRQVLLPIFQNQRELPEVRMAAFGMIMYTHPEKSIMDQLVFTTINDRSQNVKSFVLTTMEALARSPSSAEQEAATHMKSALKMVKMQPEELRSSRKYRVPIYVSEQQDTEEQNLFLGLASIVSPTNMLPIHLSSSIRSAFNGEATEENIQLSFSQKNLELYGEKISEFIQKYVNAANDQDRDTMERQSAKDLRQIYSSLGIKNRRTGSYYLDSEESSEKMPSKKIGESQPFGMIVLRVNDVDQVIVPISEQQLPQLVQKLLKGEKPLMSHYDELSQQLAGGQRFRQHIGIVGQEKRTKIPTTSGLPLALTRQTSVLGSIEGELKARFESERLESSRGLTAELRFRTSGIASHQHKVSVWSPVIVSGVETTRTLELNTPVDVKLRFDGNKVEIKANMLQEDVRFAALHTLPVTFTRQFDMKTRTEKEPRVKTVQNWALEHTQQEFQRESQDAIHLEGHLHRVSNMKQWIQALYTTENNVHVYYRPNERTPKELTLRIISDMFQKHSQHSRPEMQDFYSPSKSFQQIYEDFEGMDLEKDEQRRERFSTYSQQYEPKDAYKHKIRLEAEAHCGQKTHKVSAEINGACDARLQHCKIFVEAQRTPLHNENREWILKAKIQTVAPEYISEESQMESKHTRMLVKMESQWGGSDKQNVLNLKIQAEPTKKTYWKPQSQQKWSQFLNKIDMVAEYKLHGAQKNAVQRAYELGKATYFWQLDVEERRSNDGEGLVRATIIVDPISRRYANLSIQTPTERLRIQQIELPIRLAPYNLQRRSQQYRSFGHLISSVTNFGGAQCKVDDRRVETFDGVSYRAPMSDCWSVLAKDCSREQPRFAVLMKKQSEEEKKVKIVLQDKTIEIIGKQQQKPIVKIDGQRVESEQELSEDGIEMTYNTIYVKRSGLNVQFDGEQVKIQLSGMYKSLQCGLCAHYNEEDTDTFRMANNERSNSLKEFHKSYTMRNEECSESQLNKHYENSEEFEIERRQPSRRQQQKNSWFDSEESEDKHYDNDEERWDQSRESRRAGPKPIKRTKVVEYSHKLCFSTEPVKRCPSGSRPDEEAKTEDLTVKFFCLERQSSQARRLQRQVRNGEIVDGSSHQPSFTEQIAQPTKCVEVY